MFTLFALIVSLVPSCSPSPNNDHLEDWEGFKAEVDERESRFAEIHIGILEKEAEAHFEEFLETMRAHLSERQFNFLKEVLQKTQEEALKNLQMARGALSRKEFEECGKLLDAAGESFEERNRIMMHYYDALNKGPEELIELLEEEIQTEI